ncbi:helix-turn-helix domain-containing protein [Streptomyces atratus]|uniref:helix-turn-helix domain-containing protein n=1 Tax=Streptomyces atratus TaxID=1893 RepID=UPI002F90FD9A
MTTASPSSAAQAARTALARRLTGLRKDAGLKSFEVADRCGGHKSKASRIENCRTLPSDADEHTADLIAQSRTASEMYQEWRRLHRSGIKAVQESATEGGARFAGAEEPCSARWRRHRCGDGEEPRCATKRIRAAPGVRRGCCHVVRLSTTKGSQVKAGTTMSA